jgi:hypothetical protein
VHSLDVSNAFVRASLAEVVYVRPPKILSDRFGSKIMKLNKALYGLKKAPLSSHFYLEKMFDTVKIIKAPTPCLYAYKNCAIVVYVDDLIISGPNVEEVTELKNIIKGLFVCMDAGAMKEYLGVLFERRDHGALVLSQHQYLLNVLQRFDMEDCKPCATPCMPKKTIDEASTEISYTTFPFREAAGSLLYLATHTRPDISFTVGMLGRAMAAPSAQDIVAVKRLMRYLSGTREYGLVLSKLEIRHSLHTRTPTGVATSTPNRHLARCIISVKILCTGRVRSRAASLCPLQRQNTSLLRVVPRT